MQQTIPKERIRAKGSTQVFRDVATLLLLVLLAVSVRFHSAGEESSVKPLPVGVQAAEADAPAPPVERASPPAEDCPEVRPAVLELTAADASPDVGEPSTSRERHLVILRDGMVHSVRITARRAPATSPSPDCCGERVDHVSS